jgi:hypothetical protein
MDVGASTIVIGKLSVLLLSITSVVAGVNSSNHRQSLGSGEYEEYDLILKSHVVYQNWL